MGVLMKGATSACKLFQFAFLQDEAGDGIALMVEAQFAGVESNLGFATLNLGYACCMTTRPAAS
jgi:hypothetical protein